MSSISRRKQTQQQQQRRSIGWLAIASCLLALLLSGQTRPVQAADPISAASVISVLHLGKEIVSSIVETWDLVDEVGDVHLPFKRGKDQKILKEMYSISQQIEHSEHQVGFFLCVMG